MGLEQKTHEEKLLENKNRDVPIFQSWNFMLYTIHANTVRPIAPDWKYFLLFISSTSLTISVSNLTELVSLIMRNTFFGKQKFQFVWSWILFIYFLMWNRNKKVYNFCTSLETSRTNKKIYTCSWLNKTL